ncbi:YPDG domain-containing protein [Streptococcus sp. LPB0406]|nr:YPDG domain-containing protein [Streptococcus sp. LPB0406]
MIKKGKHFLFGCSLVFAVGAALVAPSVQADQTDPVDSSAKDTTVKPETQNQGETYGAPAVEAPIATEANTKPVLATAPEANAKEKATEPSAAPVVATTKESDSVQAPSLTTVADASALTAEEISNVTEAIKGSNPTAVSVQVSNDGSAIVTFADGSSATLSASQTVKVKAEATSEAPTRSRRALSPVNGTTRSFDSELQNEAQKKAIYSPGVKGEKQTYQGTVWLYRNGTVNNDNQEDAKRLGGVNVYLQYVTGKGFVSPVYKTTSEQDGTFVFDLSKSVANRLGATGEFQLAGDPKLAIRTWVENPDPTKYTVIKSGDQRTGFHGRLSRLNETWDFTAGINRIVGGQVVLQEKPNSEDYLLKPEADRQTGDQADGQFSRKGDYGTIRGRVWYELRDPSGSDARMYKKDSYDINATNVKVAASYVNDEVTRLFDKWKKEHKNYKLDDFKAAQAEIIKEYEAKNGKGSHIAETVVVPVDKDGYYRIPFRGLYGVSADKANSGLSKKISDAEFGTLVKDEDLDNEHLMKWNGTIGQKYRHINTDYVYATVLVNDYAIWSNNYQSNMFEGTSDAVLPVGPSSLAAANISNTNFALIAPQPMHDILVYDNSDHFAKPGNTAESTTGGLMPSREYQIRWFKDGKAIGEATTVMSTAEGTAKSVPLTVPNDLTEPAIYTSAVFLQGEDTSDLHSALALDSFTAVLDEETDKYTPKYADTLVTPGTPATATPTFTDKGGKDTPAPEGAKYSIPSDFVAPEGYTVSIDENTGKITVEAKPGTTVEEVEVPVKVTYKDNSTDTAKATFKLDTDGDKIPDVTDEDDDNDGVKDSDETTDGTNTKDPNSIASKITPIDDQTGVVGKEITPVTVTVEKVPTDGSIKVEGLPDGVSYDPVTKQITGTPTTEGESEVTITVLGKNGQPVKGADGQPVTETFKFTVTKPATDADKNTPTAKEQTVNKGETPDAKNSIGNTGDLPSGTTYAFKDPVDTTTTGDKGATVVVTYPDGSKDEVPVTVKVVENPTQADQNTPTAKDQTVKKGETPDAKNSIGNTGDLPSGTTYAFKDPVDTTTTGDKGATVVVTYPDGSKDEVPVTVKVVENPTQADQNTPTAKDQTVKKGETPDAKNSIGNTGDLPSGTTYAFKDPVDTTTTGDKGATVVVTYPDGSKDEVPVTVKVVENPTQADQNTPTAKDQTVKKGETPDAKNSIGNTGDLPSGTTYAFKDPVDTTTTGDKGATVVVTYPDGSKDEVPVTVKVVENPTQADQNTPTAKDQIVKKGETPEAKNSIGNTGDLPSGTTYAFKDPVDTTTTGDKGATVVVTYPDGSKDEVPVTVKVVENPTQADQNTPTAKDQTVKKGETPDAKNSIGNTGDLPSGTTYAFKDPVDTTTTGDKGATVVVTYPDGSKDEDPVTVKVVENPTQADQNTPTAKDQTVKKGETPDAKNSIGNTGDLPSGTTYAFKDPVDTTTTGDKGATVVVTYPDGSKDEVPVTVKVVENPTQADQNTPTAKDQTVKKGETPDAKNSIGNTGDLPSGTTYAFKDPVDTTTTGDKGATVVVTYPDGSKDEVPVTVKVVENPTQADQNTPTAKDQTVKKGETPDAKNSIGNTGDLPSGTTYAFKDPVDTTTTGDKGATVVVTYPDGSKDEVPVTVKVVDPKTDADKNTPTPKDQTVNVGETPDPKKSIGNVGDLPSGTKFEFKTPVDTTTPGDKSTTVVVTYPDGSKDEVPVTVKVVTPNTPAPVTPSTDADKNTPTAKDQTVKPGDKPNAKDSIGNVGDLPSGTKFEYKTPVDTTTPGEKDAIVVVTYPDGSKDEVPVKVTVAANAAPASDNTPAKKAGAKELPNTGTKQSSASLALALLAAATGGLLIAKKREEEE